MDISLDFDPISESLNDLLIENGNLVLIDGVDAIRQHVLQRLRIFLGEWFMDNTIGLPFFDQILIKNPDQSKVDAIFQNVILGTPGIIQLSEYSFSPDFITRTLSVSFRALATSGPVNYAGVIVT